MPLTPDELSIIRAHGVPLALDPRFVVLGPGDGIRFTERGRELYRVALLMYGLPAAPVDKARTKDDLRAISLSVKQARFILVADEAERAERAGKIPSRSRAVVHAILHGNLEDFHNAVQHRLACERAGRNVIPLPRRKSSA